VTVDRGLLKESDIEVRISFICKTRAWHYVSMANFLLNVSANVQWNNSLCCTVTLREIM
jgi:hypothetical protein